MWRTKLTIPFYVGTLEMNLQVQGHLASSLETFLRIALHEASESATDGKAGMCSRSEKSHKKLENKCWLLSKLFFSILFKS